MILELLIYSALSSRSRRLERELATLRQQSRPTPATPPEADPWQAFRPDREPKGIFHRSEAFDREHQNARFMRW